MHSNFRLTKWNIYKATFKVILINVPFALPARCSKTIRRPHLQLELVKLPIAAGVFAAAKILVGRMATSILRASSSDPSAGWGTGTWAAATLHCHCRTKGANGDIWAGVTEQRQEWKRNIHCPTNVITPGGLQTFQSWALNTVVHQSLQLGTSCGFTHSDSPSLPHNTEKQHKGTPSTPRQHPGAIFPFPSSSSTGSANPTGQPQALLPSHHTPSTIPACPPVPTALWLDNKTFMVF